MRQIKLIRVAKTKQMVQLKDGEKLFWANAKVEVYKNAQAIGSGDVLAEIDDSQPGVLPTVTKLMAFNQVGKENTETVNTSEKIDVEKVNTQMESKTGNGAQPTKAPAKTTVANANVELIRATAETVTALVGSVTPENVVETIKKIYQTYKELI